MGKWMQVVRFEDGGKGIEGGMWQLREERGRSSEKRGSLQQAGDAPRRIVSVLELGPRNVGRKLCWCGIGAGCGCG